MAGFGTGTGSHGIRIRDVEEVKIFRRRGGDPVSDSMVIDVMRRPDANGWVWACEACQEGSRDRPVPEPASPDPARTEFGLDRRKRPRSADADEPACLEFSKEFLLRRGRDGPDRGRASCLEAPAVRAWETTVSSMTSAHVWIHDQQLMAIKALKDLGSASATARICNLLAARIRTPELNSGYPKGADGAG